MIHVKDLSTVGHSKGDSFTRKSLERDYIRIGKSKVRNLFFLFQTLLKASRIRLETRLCF